MKHPEDSSATVGLLIGSAHDWPIVRPALDTLARLGIVCEARVLSAHRAPDLVAEYARAAEARGLRVIIAAAGGAAHLAGIVAAHTPLPVIGIPVAGGALNGLDALLSTVQMPEGVPVATVACGKSGPVNAALLAAQILGAGDPEIRRKLADYKLALRDRVLEADAKLQKEIGGHV